MPSSSILKLGLLLMALPLTAQTPDSVRPAAGDSAKVIAPRPGSPLTNAGVVRATAQVDSVFISRLTDTVTIDGGDFLASLLARIGAGRFDDSAGFRVTVDSNVARINGRLQDFSPEKRRELGAFFSFLDSTTVWTAEISLPQKGNGVMRFRLERLLIGTMPIPELILAPALSLYASVYPELSAGGREFLIAIPESAQATLLEDRIRLTMPPGKPTRDSIGKPARSPDNRSRWW